jgi:hypothetical protein
LFHPRKSNREKSEKSRQLSEFTILIAAREPQKLHQPALPSDSSNLSLSP